MTLIAMATVVLLCGLVVFQGFLTARFVAALCHYDVPLVADHQAPRAMVVLCLRGSDPFLENCLRGLLSQDYPNFSVYIVVDGATDPAHETLREVLAERPTSQVTVQNLRDRYPTCSLKCSALIQAMRHLDPRCEIVAQIDADTVPHPTWLRELATALSPADVGAATGNRWYMPREPSIGALVRYIWNAAAVTQMHNYHIAWGGTLATKARVLRESDLVEKWGQAFCEDTMLHSELKSMGLRLAFVPGLMMINRESTTLTGFYRWVKRQMLNTRLYHPAWKAIVAHCALSTVAPLIALAILLSASSHIGERTTTVLWWALNCFSVSFFLCLLPLVGVVRRIVRSRGECTDWITFGGVLKAIVAFPLAQLIHAGGTFAALLARSADWRGIHYRIAGPWQVRMEQYRPFQSVDRKQSDDLDQYRTVA